MTKVRILALLAGIVLLLAIPSALLAQANAGPATWDGAATLDGEAVADGTMITAMVDGYTGDQTYMGTITDGIYFIMVAQPPGENFAGLDVTFMVGDAMATEVATWSDRGDNRDFALTAMMGAMEEGAGLAIGLFANNGSGQSGRATLTQIGDDTEVILSLNRGALLSELVHIHNGSCEATGGIDKGLELTSFVAGSGGSTTLVPATLEHIQDGYHYINVHMAGNPGTSTACGNIPATGEDQPLRAMPKAMEAGEAGEAGEKGEKGEKGAPGSAGPKGDTGGTGLTGSPGSRGAAGNTGAAGAAGADGANGSNGTAGAQGPPGAAGSAGTPGDDGGGGALGVIALILAIVALVGVGGAFAMSRRS